MSTFATDWMQVMVERKLTSEISRKDHDLRRMLGHFEMLERVNSGESIDEASRLCGKASSNTRIHQAEVETGSKGSDCSEWSELDKDMVMIEGVEVDGDDDTTASGDGSLPEEDELPEYDDVSGARSIHIEGDVYHSPPSYVEDALDELNKLSLQPSFEETTYEVSEDD